MKNTVTMTLAQFHKGSSHKPFFAIKGEKKVVKPSLPRSFRINTASQSFTEKDFPPLPGSRPVEYQVRGDWLRGSEPIINAPPAVQEYVRKNVRTMTHLRQPVEDEDYVHVNGDSDQEWDML